jgi:hypothetical protein
MHDLLIQKAFDKARIELESINGIAPTKSKCAQFLSDYLFTRDFPYSAKSLSNHFNAVEHKTGYFEIKQSKVVALLSVFLGYDDYIDFCNQHKKIIASVDKEVDKEYSPSRSFYLKSMESVKKNKSLIAIGLAAVLIGLVTYFSNTPDQRWMEWKAYSFEEVVFDPARFKEGRLELWNEERSANFKQVAVGCNSIFFDYQGAQKIWYGKNASGTLEYFTSTGKHPQTEKLVKPITVYMIKKYVCSEYVKR